MLDSHALTVLSLGLVLGLRHALDADHIAAVTTILAERPTVRASSAVGLFWGLGHTLTLVVMGFGVLALDLRIPERLANLMEFIVGVMLVVLGLTLARKLVRDRWHVHTHEHDGQRHVHAHSHRLGRDHFHGHWMRGALRPLAVGMVHGLAGSAALMIVVLSAVASVTEGIAYLLLFGMGSILGMVGLSTVISLPIVGSYAVGRRVFHTLQGCASVVSMGLGFIIMLRTGLQGIGS